MKPARNICCVQAMNEKLREEAEELSDEMSDLEEMDSEMKRLDSRLGSIQVRRAFYTPLTNTSLKTCSVFNTPITKKTNRTTLKKFNIP